MQYSIRSFAALAAVALACAFPPSLFALDASPAEGLIESDAVRRKITDEWLDDEINHVLALKKAEYTDRYLYRFSVSQKKDASGGFVAVTVKPEDSPGIRGTWVLFRHLADGQADSIRIYPNDDPSMYVRLRPSSDDPLKGRSFLDLVILDTEALHGVPIGIPFFQLYGASFSSVVSMTRTTVPWGLVSNAHNRSPEMEAAVQAVRDGIKNLVYLDDGAFNERGEPVLIETGKPQDPKAILAARPKKGPEGDVYGGVNCSGFAKWIVDGIVRPRAGAGLLIEPLKGLTPVPDNLFTDPFMSERDIFFGLNWTRNLAAAVVSLDTGRTVKPENAGVDVTVEPMSALPPYQQGVGYRAGALAPLLYYLAVSEPGHFYLGAVSRERGDPPLREFHHIAAFFPYFDESGKFTIAVFESAAETTIESFSSRNADAFVNLVRIKIPENGHFEP